jgi:hypothetical protein
LVRFVVRRCFQFSTKSDAPPDIPLQEARTSQDRNIAQKKTRITAGLFRIKNQKA